MDIEDYVTMHFIGPDNHEVDCVVWEDAAITHRATHDAFIMRFNTLMNTLTQILISYPNERLGSPALAILNSFVYDKFYPECYLDFQIQRTIFWNTRQCSDIKMDIVPITFTIPTVSGDRVDIIKNIDFADGQLTEKIWYDYEASFKAFMCCVKQAMVLLNGEEFFETNFTEFNEVITD